MTNIKTVNIRGKAYVEVAERVRLVHDQKRAFEVIESEPFTVGDRTLWRVTILVDEKKYKGNAEVKLNAPANSPDGTNPFECAETSAIGRALAFAGFGTVESIASADEVARALLGTASPPRPPQTSKPRDDSYPAPKALIASAHQMYQRLGVEPPPDLTRKSAQAVRGIMEGLTGQLREQMNASRGHPTQPTSTVNAPDALSLRKRCSELHIDWNDLLTTHLGGVKPLDNIIPEECAKLKRALDAIVETRAKKAEQAKAS